MSEVKSISVTQLARRIRNLLEIQVGEIWVEGFEKYQYIIKL